MKEELRRRRRETFEMLVVKGYDYRRVCQTLSDRYGVQETTIETDIGRMSDWIDRLAHYDDDKGIGRLLELQSNRQRMHQMATEARNDDDLDTELKVRKSIDKSLMTEVELAQSLGQMARQPDEAEITHRGDGDNPIEVELTDAEAAILHREELGEDVMGYDIPAAFEEANEAAEEGEGGE